jgi:hypothetical protein
MHGPFASRQTVLDEIHELTDVQYEPASKQIYKLAI